MRASFWGGEVGIGDGHCLSGQMLFAGCAQVRGGGGGVVMSGGGGMVMSGGGGMVMSGGGGW